MVVLNEFAQEMGCEPIEEELYRLIDCLNIIKYKVLNEIANDT